MKPNQDQHGDWVCSACGNVWAGFDGAKVCCTAEEPDPDPDEPQATMEPRRIEVDAGYECVLNYDGWHCGHPETYEEQCPEKLGGPPPSWCPLRQRPALVVLRTGDEK